MKKILFFDCETNGLPIDYKASYTDVNNWPRVIQLAWILTDEQGLILNQNCALIRPDGWEMPTEPFWTDNGYSQEKSMAEGIPIKNVLNQLLLDKQQAEILVAHNLNFDHRIVWAEYIRNRMEPRSGLHKICTMMKSTNYCQLPGKRGYKWPTLTELHTKLFNAGFDKAHDAMADVAACMTCFFELVKRGVISTEIPVEQLK